MLLVAQEMRLLSKIIKSIFIPEENRTTVVKIPIPDVEQLVEPPTAQPELEPEVSQEDVKMQAAQILAEAQEEAASLLATAQAEADVLREEARSQGYQEGLAQGRSEAETQRAEAMAEFQSQTAMICEALNSERKAIISGATEDLLKLILLFPEKIIRTTVAVDTEVMVSILEAAVAKVDGVTRIEVRLHPEDLNIIRQIEVEKGLGTAETALEFIADPQLPRYSCIVNTATALIDASLEAQFNELEQVLRAALQRGQASES